MRPDQLQNEARAAAQLREALGSLLDEDDDQLVQDTLDGETGLLDAIRIAMDEQAKDEADALYLKQRLDQMDARKARLERRIKARKSAVARAMLLAGMKTIREPEWTLSAREGGWRVKIENEALLPAEYLRQPEPPKPTPDKDAILAAMSAGKLVPGAAPERGELVLTVRRV